MHGVGGEHRLEVADPRAQAVALEAQREPVEDDLVTRRARWQARQLVEGDDVAFSLWSDSDDWRDAELAVDGVSARFGTGAVRPASLLSRSAPESAKGIDISDTLATRSRSSD